MAAACKALPSSDKRNSSVFLWSCIPYAIAEVRRKVGDDRGDSEGAAGAEAAPRVGTLLHRRAKQTHCFAWCVAGRGGKCKAQGRSLPFV
jgi:hypothetical protein